MEKAIARRKIYIIENVKNMKTIAIMSAKQRKKQ